MTDLWPPVPEAHTDALPKTRPVSFPRSLCPVFQVVHPDSILRYLTLGMYTVFTVSAEALAGRAFPPALALANSDRDGHATHQGRTTAGAVLLSLSVSSAEHPNATYAMQCCLVLPVPTYLVPSEVP